MLQGQMAIYGENVNMEESLNDRLADSPKNRSYVPLLSKKLKKTNHGSSENVIRTIQNTNENSSVRQSSQSNNNRRRTNANLPRSGGNGANHQMTNKNGLDLTTAAMEFEQLQEQMMERHQPGISEYPTANNTNDLDGSKGNNRLTQSRFLHNVTVNTVHQPINNEPQSAKVKGSQNYGQKRLQSDVMGSAFQMQHYTSGK